MFLMLSRSSKRVLLRVLGPLDACARRINGRPDMPPLHLRWEVGPLRGYDAAGAEFRLLLQLFGGLRPESRMLDIGCGCGQMAMELREKLGPEGSYEGWDINPGAIRWCADAIAAEDPRFSFRLLDVRNGLYHPSGGEDPSALVFPGKGSFDVILLKSVFTHMLAAEVENYLSQISGLLSDRGKCVATFFLLNDARRASLEAGRVPFAFKPFASGVSVSNPDVPEEIVAYEEPFVMEILSRSRLRMARPFLAGAWAGDRSGLSHQDILILERDA
jgi:SAM-dependent methyltransferase